MKLTPPQRFAVNDLRRERAVNASIGLVLLLSAFLMATGSMVMERTLGSIDALFEQAQPPHFLQMHTGDYDSDALAGFAAAHPEIDDWFVAEMLGFDSATITWERPSSGERGDVADSLLQNLFVTQNEGFDLLLDAAGDAPVPDAGEVAVPVVYQQRYGLEVGDVLRVATDSGAHEFVVSGFVRDAQMASSLSAATRFVVSDADFARLGAAGGGAEEIIVEYLLADPSLANALQSDYEADPAVPKNGQAVTFVMIRTINAVSEGLIAITLVLVSLALIVIALLSVRFVIRGTIEGQVRQIGVMKAIGLPHGTITGLYLAKHRVLTIAACVLGGALAVFGAQVLASGARQNLAEAEIGLWSVIVPVISLAVVYLFVIGICRGVLRGVRRIEVVGALMHGSTRTERQTARRTRMLARRVRRTSIGAWRAGSMNARLALVDLRAELGQWMLVPVLFCVTTMLVILPTNLLTTFESPRFATYMGAPIIDLRADVQFTDGLDAAQAALVDEMRADDRITEVVAFAGVLAEVGGSEGTETLRVDVGDHGEVSIEYESGGAPADGEIALSMLNAERLGAGVGDEVTMRLGGEPVAVTVSGLSQDVSSGGRTAKMAGDLPAIADPVSYVVYANTREGVDPAQIAAEYGAEHPTAVIVPMREYVRQTLAYVTDAFRGATMLALAFGVGVAALVTGLFLRLRLARDRRAMGVLSAIGFSSRELAGTVRGTTLVMVGAGVLAGAVIAATLGEAAVGTVIGMSGVGITQLRFIENPWLVWVAYPAGLVTVGWLVSIALTVSIRRADKSAWLKGADGA